MIKSISYDQTEIIQNILTLHVPQGFIDIDPTYSKGNFYKKIPEPKLKFDIKPQTEDTIQADCTNLPLKKESVNCIMFDPPFLATSGPSLKLKNKSNAISRQYSVYPSEKELHLFYKKSLREFYRLLVKKGVLIFKCQDKVSSGKQYFSHTYIHNMALEIGFYPKDLFILLVDNRISAAWQNKNQKHARKFHSYFWVFEKIKSKVKYEEFMGEI